MSPAGRAIRGLTSVLLLAVAIEGAAACSAHSGSRTAVLVELYTSEGCSSCPPADRWLSSLARETQASSHVVPLGLHVDYWDYIGWKDPYGRNEFSTRQRERARARGATFVYTPQVLLNGEDFRGWYSGGFERALERLTARPAQAALFLELVRREDTGLEVKARVERTGSAATERAALYLAVFENGLETAVRAGENRGRQLRHDYVVRGWSGAIPVPPGPAFVERRTIRMPQNWKAERSGVAAFLESRPGGEILQAVSLPSCPA